MAKTAYGVESIEFAPLGVNGAIPTSGWVKITHITDGSVTFVVPPVATNDIRVEDIDGVVEVLPGDTDPATISAASLDLDGEKAETLFGGTFIPGSPAVEEPPAAAVPSGYDAPALPEIVHLAMRITSRPHKGKKFQFFLRDAAILADISANFTRAEMVSLGFTARSTTPVDGSGNAVSPWGWRILDV